MAEEQSSQYVEEKNVLPHEELFKVREEDLQLKLHRSIGALNFLDKNGNSAAGTGLLISKDMVLTSAHNLFDKKGKTRYEGVKFFLPTNGIADRFYAVEDVRYLSEFQTCPNDQKLEFDYALIKLKREVTFEVGIKTIASNLIRYRSLTNLKEQFFQSDFLPVSLPCPICIMAKKQNSLLQIYGYPVNYGENYKMHDKYGKKCLNQYGRSFKNRIVMMDSKEFKIGYEINTEAGQSGCPVILDKKVIGVHNGGGKHGENFNIGRLITCDMVDNLTKWCKQLKGDSFEISYKQVCLHLKVVINEHRNAKYPIQLFLFNQNLKTFKRPNPSSVTILNLASNKLTEIDLRNYTNLLQLDISLNQLKEIDLRDCKSLHQLNLRQNQIITLNITNNYLLRSIDLSSNNITNINLINNTSLTNIYLSDNKINEIDLQNNKLLTCLLISKNKLTSIDLTNCCNLVSLQIQENLLSELDLRKNKIVESLNLDANYLKMITLWINSKIPIKFYMEKAFSFCNQYSKNCKVRLVYRQEDLLDCFRVHKAWEQKYSILKGYNDKNIANCRFIFEYFKQK